MNGNVVERNLITFSVDPDNVGSFFGPGPVGHDNVVRHNCLFGGGSDGGVPPSPIGFTASNNVVDDPHYVDRSAKDFRLEPNSPCAAALAGP